MNYYIQKLKESEKANEIIAKECLDLKKQCTEMEDQVIWLSCLEQAGVYNWEGYNIAIDIKKKQYED